MLWLGTYREKGGQGLHPLGLDLALGPPDFRIVDASYAVWAAESRTAYFVEEQESGKVAAWGFAGGRWEDRGRQETGGALPCYLSLSPDRRFLAAANYGDGSVALLALDPPTGRILDRSDAMQCQGRGPNPERQDGPHAHCALFDETGRFLYHVDLGQDLVLRHRIADGRFVGTDAVFRAPPGAGPRHFAFHPDGRHALLLTELSAELFLFGRTETGLELLDRIATSHRPGEGNLGGHLAIGTDGVVLVTNRGHDSLAAFALEGDRLQPLGWVRTGAASPRHFHVCPAGVIVAHEEGEILSLVPLPCRGSAGEGPSRTAPAPGAAFIFAISDR